MSCLFTIAPKDEEKTDESWKFRRQIPEMTKDPTHENYLKRFSHIDYRNCQCANIISYLFWILYEHIEKSGKLDYKIII